MSLLLQPVEHALNAALKQDTSTAKRLMSFEQRKIVVTAEDWQQSLTIRFEQSRIKLGKDDTDDADLLIRGKAIDLLSLVKQPEKLFSGAIHIHGNVGFAKQLQDVVEGFEFDWEQQLANLTGDVLAQPLSYGIKQGLAWLSSTRQSLSMSMSEYLREEAHYLPHQLEVNDFLQDVDKVRADVDRLEARLKRLETHR
ncbi:MAG TPA: hypothetical protein ENI26_05130 [Methylophaga aminisulfidivorans]|uniref:Ubiquinone biosynthesis accessory factor UbiJ n=2 Tax=root TaxID=1 RepID=A0A7C1ZPJ1_9GAMM|nr:hypothetical protein [Methylophaga aminisulfidivorans]